jgi:hypothetical protein
MNDDGRTSEVLRHIKLHARRLRPVAETRCPHDGRLLGAAYQLPDGLWIWSAGHREPPKVARRQAASFYLDALDECQTDEERAACFDAASEALSADIRPVATAAVMHVDIDPSNPARYRPDPFAMATIGGQGLFVTEVSCGCRRHFYLDLHGVILRAADTMAGAASRTRPRHVPPLPPDLPERVAQRLYDQVLSARA